VARRAGGHGAQRPADGLPASAPGRDVHPLPGPTEEWVEHPSEPGVQGRAWRYHQPPAAPRRVLVTGSRTWTDTPTIRDALASVWGNGDAVLVSGGRPRGTDRPRRRPARGAPPPSARPGYARAIDGGTAQPELCRTGEPQGCGAMKLPRTSHESQDQRRRGTGPHRRDDGGIAGAHWYRPEGSRSATTRASKPRKRSRTGHTLSRRYPLHSHSREPQ